MSIHDLCPLAVQIAHNYGLKIVKEKIFNFKIEDSVLEREKKIVEYELKQIMDDPFRVGISLAFENIFREHPYRYPVYGKTEVVNSAHPVAFVLSLVTYVPFL